MEIRGRKIIILTQSQVLLLLIMKRVEQIIARKIAQLFMTYQVMRNLMLKKSLIVGKNMLNQQHIFQHF